MKTQDKYASIRLENQLCFPLWACSKDVVRKYRKPLETIGLTYTQYIVMMAMWEHERLTEGQLGEIVRLDSGTLAPLLKRLEKQGLVTRSRLEGNERKLLISLTSEGSELKEKALEVPKMMDGCLDAPREDLLELKRILDNLLNSEKECSL